MLVVDAFWLSPDWGSGTATINPSTIAVVTSVLSPAIVIPITVSAATISHSISINVPVIERSESASLAPNAILVGAGSVATIDEDPDAPDNSWITNQTELRVAFDVPPANLLSGAGKQKFRIRVRRN